MEIINYILNYIRKISDFCKNSNIDEDVINEAAFGLSEIEEYLDNIEVKSVLEIGSGTGLLINYLANKYPKINFEGIEPHKAGHDRFIKTLEKYNKVRIYKDEIGDFKPRKKYDLIFSVNVLEHIENWKEYIEKSSQLLNKGSLNIILCPNHEFPYESHYIIPIIFNKEITRKIFYKRIRKYEIKNNANGHYDALNFIKKKNLSKYLDDLQLNYEFDEGIKYRILNRLNDDKALLRRQKIIGKISYILMKLRLHKFILEVLGVPFPYMKLIQKNILE